MSKIEISKSYIDSRTATYAGTVIADFGLIPTSDVTIIVTGQVGISDNSIVSAWITPIATDDHSIDDHKHEAIQAVAFNPSAAAQSFEILVKTLSAGLQGKWTVGWRWQ